MTLHIVPNGDLVEHATEDDCVCGPTPEYHLDGVLMVHHSLDGREKEE